MSIRPAFSFWCAVLLCGSALAQDLHISGTVVNSVTGAPIAGALVTASTSKVDEREPQRPAAALTEPGGVFRIGGLTQGLYLLRADKPGYSVEAAFPPTELTSSREGLVFQLKPLAKIAGTIAERDGNPVPHAAIRAFRATIRDGKRVWTQSRSVSTDDLGRYRLWNLQPGEYYVLAAGRSGGTTLAVGHTAATVNSHESFAPVYYGGATDRAGASPIVLAAGQEFAANIRVTLRPAYRVRGRIQSLQPSQPVKVELLRGGHDVSTTRAFVNTASGAFDLQDVVPGTYLLRVTQGAGEAVRGVEREIEVREADLDGILVALADPIDIPVNVRATGPAAGNPRGIPASVVLEKEDTLRGMRRDGDRWLIRDVLPGRYRVSVSAFQGYVLSATAGNQDLLTNPDLIVSPGTAIEIVIDPDAGTITGTAPAMDDLRLLLIPSGGGEPRAEPVFQGIIRVNAAPGNYDAFLVKGSEFEYRNPDALRRLGRGVPVRVEKGATVNVELKEVSR